MSDMHNMQMKGRLPCMDYVYIKSMKYQLSCMNMCEKNLNYHARIMRVKNLNYHA